ncbi:MAG: division/cell wall cluster transcriptional repressor MraZ [Clostridia bacterium]|nr:division/cell wall cluster transcriptional repressor MraZ [Clostridia bacterium]
MLGKHRHNVDTKGRMFVPAKFRAELGEAFVAAAVMDHCICLYSAEEWGARMAKLSDQPMTEKVRKLSRLLGSRSDEVSIDAQGRINLNKELLAYAGIEKEVLVIGAGTRAEIWNPTMYEQAMAEIDDDEIEAALAEAMF